MAARLKRVSIEERGISHRRCGGLRHYARSVIDTLAPRLLLYLRYRESLHQQNHLRYTFYTYKKEILSEMK